MMSVGWRLLARPAAVSARWASSAAAGGQQVRPYDHIPGPKPLPLLGNAWRFIPKIGDISFDDFYQMSRQLRTQYGDIVRISQLPGRKDMVVLFDPEAIAHVYQNEGQWPQRLVLESVKYFRDKVRPHFFQGNQGLLNENGEKWQEARTAVNQPMMRVDVANLYVPKTDQVSREFVAFLATLRSDKGETPADTLNELQKWALESICLIALDTRLGCVQANLGKESDAQRMIDAVNAVFELSFQLDLQVPVWKLFTTPTLRKFIKYEDDILEIAVKYVEQARSKIDLAAPESGDLSVLHRILKRDPSTKRAVIAGMDIILAGVDTTSNAAAITLYYLANNPDKQQKLFREVKGALPDAQQPITAHHLDQMKYMKACIKEATRLRPVATSNVRTISKDIVLNNYLIPGGKADMFMFNGALYADPAHYPQPEQFIPERWLRGEQVQCPVRSAHRTHPFVYLPFGHGPRACPGMRFANMEMETLIARMLLRFQLEWHQPDMTFSSQFLQTPSSPLKFTLRDRE